MEKTVSIIIPNWNGRDKLERNLPYVLAVRGVREVIVVDDASTDDSVQFIQGNFPQIKLICQNKNHGFSTTVNIGVKEAEGEYVFILNTDAVPEQNCVDNALKGFKENVFSISCNTGGSWSWAKFENGYFWHFMAPLTSTIHQTLWASGGSGIFRKKIWDELGGLDELYNRFYEEDVDLGYRATKRGYINLWDPDSKVEHYKQKGVIEENFSKNFVSKVAQRNQLIFIWKNIHDKDLIREHKRVLVKKILSHPRYFWVFFSALLRLPKVKEERASEKALSKLNDREIINKF